MSSPSLAPALAAVAMTLGVASIATRSSGGWPSAPVRPGAALGLRRLGAMPLLRRLAGAARLQGSVERAGVRFTVEDLVTAKWLAAGAATVSVLGAFGPSPALPLIAFASFRVPDLWLTRAATRRRARADRELPVLLDMLAASATAGLSGQLAVRRATEATEGPLAEELSAALRRTELGGRWKAELGTVAERLDLPDLHRAVTVLTRSDTIGSSLVGSLVQIAADGREARRAALSERARKAPVKMLFPLVFLVLPAFLLLTVVPVLVTTLRSIR